MKIPYIILVIIAAVSIASVITPKPKISDTETQKQLALKISSDPENYAWHNKGNTDGACLGFAFNLLYRLQNETTLVTELYQVVAFNNAQPTAPKDHDSEMWGHAFIVFFTPWPDNKCYAADQMTGEANEVDLNRVDWTSNAIDCSFANECLKTMWSKFKTRYPFSFDSFNVVLQDISHGKSDCLSYFNSRASLYCKSQGHPYYFPLDWCED